MITVEVFRNPSGFVTGCKISGHAGMAERGQDIVCAAVSALAYTAAASLQKLLSADLDGDMQDGRMEFHLVAPADDKTQLLFESMLLGVSEIVEQYPDRVRISEKRR